MLQVPRKFWKYFRASNMKKNDADLDECEHLEGCVMANMIQNARYMKEKWNCRQAECAHLEGCVGELRDKDSPL